MDFLRFVLGSLFLGFFGLFLYRYEQFNRFQFKVHENILYVIDKKNRRIIRKDAQGFKVLIKGTEDFLNHDYFVAPEAHERSPLPQEVDTPVESLQLDIPYATEPSKAELAVQEFEHPQKNIPPLPVVTPPEISSPSQETPPLNEPKPLPKEEQNPAQPKTPPISNSVRNIAKAVAENAIVGAITESKTYKRFVKTPKQN